MSGGSPKSGAMELIAIGGRRGCNLTSLGKTCHTGVFIVEGGNKCRRLCDVQYKQRSCKDFGKTGTHRILCSSRSVLHPGENMSATVCNYLKADSHTMGKTVAAPGGRSLITKRAPFSDNSPVRRVPLTEKLISVARGCVWGVLIEQGPRNPIAIVRAQLEGRRTAGGQPTHGNTISNNGREVCGRCFYRMPTRACHNARRGLSKIEYELGPRIKIVVCGKNRKRTSESFNRASR
jgi:hypothetical protein